MRSPTLRRLRLRQLVRLHRIAGCSVCAPRYPIKWHLVLWDLRYHPGKWTTFNTGLKPPIGPETTSRYTRSEERVDSSYGLD